MKAKDYYKMYMENPTDETLVKVVNGMMYEIKEIAKARNSNKVSVWASIFNEMSLKWRAFVRLVGDENIKPEGFENYFKKTAPVIYEVIKES